MRALLTFFVFISLANAQAPVDPNEFLVQSHFRNADVKQLWQRLGISGKIRKTTQEGSKDTEETFDCSPDDRCESRLFNFPWPLGSDGYDAVVRISPSYLDRNLSRFLLFHRQDVGWRFVDYLDSTEWDYEFPEVSAINSAGRRWLVLKAWPHCGTGCSLIHTDWFELNNGKLRMVLTVPLSGHDGNENPRREFETRFVRARQTDRREMLEFIYHVEFSSGFGSSIDVSNLWDEEKVIRFSRPDGQGEFKFDAKNSEASETFGNKIFSSLDVGVPQLFELVQDHFLQIARGPNDRRREWLKEVLEQNPALPQLARVREAFRKSQ